MPDYNARLKPNKRKEKCGDAEKTTDAAELADQGAKLAKLLRESTHTVVFTGRGTLQSSN